MSQGKCPALPGEMSVHDAGIRLEVHPFQHACLLSRRNFRMMSLQLQGWHLKPVERATCSLLCCHDLHLRTGKHSHQLAYRPIISVFCASAKLTDRVDGTLQAHQPRPRLHVLQQHCSHASGRLPFTNRVDAQCSQTQLRQADLTV